MAEGRVEEKAEKREFERFRRIWAMEFRCGSRVKS
jgi:hypothetical protein